MTTGETALLTTAGARFETLLGDPLQADSALSWHSAMVSDEAETYPAAALEQLHRFALHRYQIPAALGGALLSYETLYALGRSISRRDVSLALCAGMQIWSHLVWMAGSPEQKEQLAADLANNLYPCLAASERGHGADLLAGEFSALDHPDHIVLRGEKWPIGMGARADMCFVLARDGEAKGPRGFSWYLVSKDRLTPGQWQPLPKVPLLGLRAADVSGFVLHDAVVPKTALIGKTGQGLELVLKLFQVTRTLVAGFSVGAADTAVRIATAFARQRVLYREPIAALPWVRSLLASAYLDLLAADALMISTVRGMHFHTEELSVTSQIAKVMVPFLTGRAIRNAAEALGARYYMRTGFAGGMFQKMMRDHAAIALFDGSTSVCLSAIAAQLPALLKALDDTKNQSSDSQLAARFDMFESAPALDFSRLELTSRGADHVLQYAEWTEDLLTGIGSLALGRFSSNVRSAQTMAVARDYCALHAAAACSEAFRSRPESWRRAAVRQCLTQGDLAAASLDPDVVDALFEDLTQKVETPMSFSLAAISLPDGVIAL